MRRNPPRLAFAIALLVPALAFANPRPNPLASGTFLLVAAAQVVAFLLVLLSAGSQWGSGLVLSAMGIGLSLVGGLASFDSTNGGLLVVPAGLLLLLASSSATGRAARLAALAATAFALVAVPYAAYESRQQSGLFGAGNALGSDEPSGELYLPAPRTDMGHPLQTSPSDASANTNSGP
jgi:hypothetical protein